MKLKTTFTRIGAIKLGFKMLSKALRFREINLELPIHPLSEGCKPCPNCGIWTNLETSGLCNRCSGDPRKIAEIVAKKTELELMLSRVLHEYSMIRRITHSTRYEASELLKE